MMAKLTDDKILNLLDAQRRKAADHQSELSKKREEFYRYYRAEPYGNERKGWSQTVLPVIWNIVEAIKPSLVEIFTGDFFVVSSVNKTPPKMEGQPLAVGMDGQMVPSVPGMQQPPMPEPPKPRDLAQDIQDYIRHKLFVQMDGEQIMDDAIHYALTSHYGVIKVTHREEYKEVREEYEYLTPEDMARLVADEMVTVSKYTAVGDESEDDAELMPLGFESVKVVRRELVYRGPWIEVIPPRELYYVPGYTSLAKCPYVAHVVKRDLDYVLRMERRGVYRKGSYEQVKAWLDSSSSTDETDGEVDALFSVDGLETPEDRNLASMSERVVLNQNEVLVEEIYTQMDIDGDGLLEPVIVTICGKVVLREPIENPYETPPFELCTALREPDKIIGRPYPEVFDTWQRMMTNLTRGVQDAAMLSTARGWKTNDAQTRRALQAWAPGDVLFTPNLQAQAELLDFGSPSAFILQAVERTQYEIDKSSGVNEAMQGLDKQAMNKTASGMEMRMSASQERQRLIARRIARSLKRIIRRVLDIMRVWPPEDDAKVVGRDISLSAEDMRAEYTVDVEVGVGPQDRKKNAEAFAALAGFLASPVALQMGIGNPDSILGAISAQYEYLDIDVSDILPDMKQVGLAQQHAQMGQQMQHLQQQMGQIQEENAFLQRKANGKDPQAEMQKMQAEHQLDAQKMTFEQQLEERRLQMEYALKEKEMLMKHELEREKLLLNAQSKAQQAVKPQGVPSAQPAQQMPQVVVVPTASGPKRVNIIRDASGAIAGADVVEATQPQ
jgi:hypothetical protein